MSQRDEKPNIAPSASTNGRDDNSATAALLKERGSRYGQFKDHAMIAQTLKCVMQGDLAGADVFINQLDHKALSAKYTSMHADQMEALEMIAHKIARILNGDPDYEDSWRDIAGYATLVADRLLGNAQ